MTTFEVLSILVAVLAAFISLVALSRAREVAARQIELQEKQLTLERESAKLAKIQREQIEEATRYPKLAVNVFPVTIHYDDATIQDTAIELIFENGSSLSRSINSCTVGFLDNDTDALPAISRQAQYRDEFAEYPIAVEPHASLILYSFARHFDQLYKDRYGPAEASPKSVALLAKFAGMPEPLVRIVARYVPNKGFGSA